MEEIFGSSKSNILNSHLLYYSSLTFTLYPMIEGAERCAAKNVIAFLTEMSWRNDFKEKIFTLFKRIKFVQIKRRRVQMLNTYKL